MAVIINTTNVSLTELETAPGGATAGGILVSFETNGRYSWNLGAFGAATYPYWTWGYGFGGGGGNIDEIYGIIPPTTGTNPPLELSDWRGLQYWFDGSTFNITIKATNNLAPNPPGDEINIEIGIADSSLNYSIFGGPSPPNYQLNLNLPGGASQAQTQIPGFTADSYVLAKNLYWFVRVNAGPNFPGGTVEMLINGTSVWNRGFPSGPFSGDLYDYFNGSAGVTNSTGCDIEITVT
jgi:hypothetical protein